VTDFRRDLFRGTAEYYDRFRVPYPPELINDLSEQASATGSGTLLDLACGTGQLTFALHERFARTWAIDQEPDMIEFVARKAAATGGGIRTAVASAEELSLPPASLDLVVIGNAFHRFPRDRVARLLHGWLKPGGHLALVWGGGPDANPATTTPEPWQQALHAVLARWRPPDRIPASYDRDRAQRPDAAVLTDAGFRSLGTRDYTVTHEWTAEALIGHAYSTSVLSRAALGDAAADFEADLRTTTARYASLRQQLSFACELAIRPFPESVTIATDSGN
jgi:SAM-dependent methyltransferase